jgi:hypothetical protein
MPLQSKAILKISIYKEKNRVFKCFRAVFFRYFLFAQSCFEKLQKYFLISLNHNSFHYYFTIQNFEQLECTRNKNKYFSQHGWVFTFEKNRTMKSVFLQSTIEERTLNKNNIWDTVGFHRNSISPCLHSILEALIHKISEWHSKYLPAPPFPF